MTEIVSEEAGRRSMRMAMRLSLVVGLLMLVMKLSAYLITGSAAILSDAAESVVHVVAVSFASYSLWLAHKPADSTHLYGHAKISFFSAGFEGAMIILAALYIIYESIQLWLGGLHLQNLGIGTALTALAALINGALGGYLVWLGKRQNSLILEANGKHVLTDCWTSVGVLIGLGLTLTTGWLPWDPICAILVAINILVSGFGLIRRCVGGLMDAADPELDRILTSILDYETTSRGISYHGLRHRSVGRDQWVEVHLLFPGSTTVRDAHAVATRIEARLEGATTSATYVTSHLEATEDHRVVHAPTLHGQEPDICP
mgnify:CR=1 FL=1